MNPGRLLLAVIAALSMGGMLAQPLSAGVFADPGLDPFQRTWERTDAPVADGVTARTWMWGPESFTIQGKLERYDESPGGERLVVYFDKSRMEITDLSADSNSIWYVTNGLLATELITGRMQVGNSAFTDRQPAQTNVAGDANDPNGPTYSTFGSLLGDTARPEGSVVIERVSRSGALTNDNSLDAYEVVVGYVDTVTNHGIAQPFWEFMNSNGIIYDNGDYITAPLFENAFFATGRPITEAYWATVQVAGTPRDVLMQCFERRCLTYTPGNPAGFVVEAGNVGRHYYNWRYTQPTPDSYPPSGELLYSSDLTDWISDSTDDGEYFAENGTYHITASVDGSPLVYLDSENPYTDVRVDLDVRMVTEYGAFADACLVTRLDPFSLSYNYELCLTNDGYTYGGYDQVDSGDYLELLPYAQRAGSTDANEWTRLSIIHRAEALWFLVNDELVGTASHTGPPGGLVGFYVYNLDLLSSVEWEFTNLAIWAVE